MLDFINNLIDLIGLVIGNIGNVISFLISALTFVPKFLLNDILLNLPTPVRSLYSVLIWLIVVIIVAKLISYIKGLIK